MSNLPSPTFFATPAYADPRSDFIVEFLPLILVLTFVLGPFVGAYLMRLKCDSGDESCKTLRGYGAMLFWSTLIIDILIAAVYIYKSRD